MLISTQATKQILPCILEGVWISDSNTLYQSGLSAPVFQGLLNETVADTYGGFPHFPGPKKLSGEMLCVNTVLSFFWGKLQKGGGRFLPYILPVTQAIHIFCSRLLRTLLFWREGSFCLLFTFISVQVVAKLRIFKKQPTAWEVLVPATTRLKVEVFLQMAWLEY